MAFNDDVEARDSLVATLVEMTDAVSASERSVRERALDTLRNFAVEQLVALERVRARSADPNHLSFEYRTSAFLADVLNRTCAGFSVTQKSN